MNNVDKVHRLARWILKERDLSRQARAQIAACTGGGYFTSTSMIDAPGGALTITVEESFWKATVEAALQMGEVIPAPVCVPMTPGEDGKQWARLRYAPFRCAGQVQGRDVFIDAWSERFELPAVVAEAAA